mmetsp:Transcript_17993/g.49647  ORF Transcript_17993/g.49647 Transcript_17993/m.49647 type:complete len:246 (-) Transcript_17993:196-933(-)
MLLLEDGSESWAWWHVVATHLAPVKVAAFPDKCWESWDVSSRQLLISVCDDSVYFRRVSPLRVTQPGSHLEASPVRGLANERAAHPRNPALPALVAQDAGLFVVEGLHLKQGAGPLALVHRPGASQHEAFPTTELNLRQELLEVVAAFAPLHGHGQQGIAACTEALHHCETLLEGPTLDASASLLQGIEDHERQKLPLLGACGALHDAHCLLELPPASPELAVENTPCGQLAPKPIRTDEGVVTT